MMQLNEETLKKEVILFGELHGTSEIPRLLSDFLIDLSKKMKFILCIEIPKEFEGKTEEYFKKERGRGAFSSKEYLTLIKNLKNKGVNICFIDDYAETQEHKEKNLCDNILKKHEEGIKIIAILGDFHAYKKVFVIDNKEIMPAGYLLNQKLGKKLASIRIASKKGSFYNNGIQKTEYNKDDSYDKGFDYTYYLENVSPCNF